MRRDLIEKLAKWGRFIFGAISYQLSALRVRARSLAAETAAGSPSLLAFFENLIEKLAKWGRFIFGAISYQLSALRVRARSLAAETAAGSPSLLAFFEKQSSYEIFHQFCLRVS